MNDPVFQAFLESIVDEAGEVNAESDVARLFPLTNSSLSGPPHVYAGLFKDVEHLERGPDRTIRHSFEPILFEIRFPLDYLSSVDDDLQFKVTRVHRSVFHPNLKLGLVCLGPGFAGGTRLKPLVAHLYTIVSSQVFATHHAFDAEARQYYLEHIDEIRSLRAPPLWRRPVASGVSVERPVPAGGGPEGVRS